MSSRTSPRHSCPDSHGSHEMGKKTSCTQVLLPKSFDYCDVRKQVPHLLEGHGKNGLEARFAT
jgi:hypothetical protein